MVNNSDQIVEAALNKLESEKKKIIEKYIPELKLWFDEQCEECISKLFKYYSKIFILYKLFHIVFFNNNFFIT